MDDNDKTVFKLLKGGKKEEAAKADTNTNMMPDPKLHPLKVGDTVRLKGIESPDLLVIATGYSPSTQYDETGFIYTVIVVWFTRDHTFEQAPFDVRVLELSPRKRNAPRIKKRT